jgi:hypothetical protein
MDRLVLMRRPDVIATRRFASQAILRITSLNESEFPSAGTPHIACGSRGYPYALK